MNLDLTTEPNKQLLKTFSKEEDQQVADDTASQVYLLAVKLKRNKITKSTEPELINWKQIIAADLASRPTVYKRFVKVNFRNCYDKCTEYYEKFTLEVDTNKTVPQLMDQVTKKQTRFSSVVRLQLISNNEDRMEGDLAKYNLQDGDLIFYDCC